MTWAGSALQGRPEIENITVSVLFVMWFGRLLSSASCLCPWPSFFFFFFFFFFPVVHWPDNSKTLECQPPRPTLFIYTPLSCQMSYQSCGQKRKITSEQQKQTHPSFGEVVSWQLDKVRLIHCLRTLPLSQTQEKREKKKTGLQDIFTLISTWRRRGGASRGAL